MKLSRSEIEGHANDALDDLKIAQRSFEDRRPRFREMMSMFAGHQWFSAYPSHYLNGEDTSDEPLPVYSLIPRIVDAYVTSKLQAMLSPDAPAAYEGVRERLRGEAAKQLMRSSLRNGIFHFEQLVRGLTASGVYGTAWFQTFWDTEAGKIITGPTGEREPEGDARVVYVSPYDLWPDPWAAHQEAMRFAYRLKFMSVREAEIQYPVDAFGKSTKGRFGGLGLFADAFSEKQKLEDGLPPESRSNASEIALIVERWDKPRREFLDGRLVSFCPVGELILDVAPIPYAFPFDQCMGEHILPNSINPLGTVYSVADAQGDYNFVRSKIRDLLNKFVNPPIFNPIGSGISADSMSTAAGKVIPYNLGHKPELGQMAILPDWVARDGDVIVSAMKDLSGFAQIPPGVAQPGMESGRAMAVQDEITNAARRVQQTLLKLMLSSIFEKTLLLQRDFYVEGRRVKVFGPNGEGLVKQFFRNDYDLEAVLDVDPFSGAPTSRALRFQERIEAFNAGWYDDSVPGARDLRREMQLDTSTSITEDPDARARRHVWEEQAAILDAAEGKGDLGLFEGDELGVFPEDRHEIHIEEDNEFMAKREFRAMDSKFQALYRQHIEFHFAYLDQQQPPDPSMTTPNGAQPPPDAGGVASPPTGGRSAYPGPDEQGAAAAGMSEDSIAPQ